MRKIKVAAMGVEHRHIFGQLNGMLNLGCECVGWWNETDNKITKDFNEKHPDIPRFTNKEDLLKNKEILRCLDVIAREYGGEVVDKN